MNDSLTAIYEARHAYVMSKLAATKGQWPEVADGSRVSVRTISKIARGEIKKPRPDILDDLTGFFREQEASQHIR